MVLPGPGLLQRTVSLSVVLQPPGSESMSTPVVTEGHVEDQGLISHLGPCH